MCLTAHRPETHSLNLEKTAMKYVSYLHAGAPSWGVALADGVTDVPRHGGAATLKQHLERGAATPSEQAADHTWEEIEYAPVIPDPNKIICVGVNYVDHRAETSRDPVAYPTIFTRFADTQIGHLASARSPEVSDVFDYEGELAVVIGAPSFQVPEEEAFSRVAGYSCYNDLTVRDWQRHTHQWTPGKNFPGTGAFGPWLVTADEIPDVRDLQLTTTVNGEVRQQAPISDLIFDIPQLIAYITTFTPLAPGDVIVSGTPGGVGYFSTPQRLLKPGDVVEVEISGVGTLRTPIE